jgi:KaiC/GvpD/RAD55 family RecA-like ATPase
MRSELTEFLSDIWQDGGRIFLAWKSNPSSFDVPPPKNWPADSEKVVNFILATAARQKDVYFAPPIYSPTAVSKTSENVLHSWVLYCEFDGNAEEGLRLLADAGLPAPSWRIQSSTEGNQHWHWKLDKPAIRSEFEPLNKKITYALNADKSGWDAGQLMRPPFTTNQGFKKGVQVKPASEVLILERTGKVYSLSDFGEIPDVKDSIVENVTNKLGDLPTIGEVLANYKWDGQHLDLFQNPPDVQGTRDESLMRMAYYCAEVGMTDEAMYVILDDVSRRLKKFLRPDRERQLAKLMSKARERHPVAVTTKTHDTTEDIQQVFTINELLNAEFKLDWLVENLIPKGTINFISAESGIGKSRFTLQLAESMASGSNFLEWPIDRKIKTMYLSLEMDRYMLKHFAEGLSKGNDYAQDISENLLLVPVGNPISLVSEDGIKYLEYLLETHQPEILFIDALGSLTLGELSEVEAKGIMSKLKGFISEYGTTFYIIHHNRKPEKSNSKSAPTLADVYGNQYIVTDAALVLTLWKQDGASDAHIELITLKSRAKKSDKNIILDGSSGFHFVFKGEKTESEEQIGEEFEPVYGL